MKRWFSILALIVALPALADVFPSGNVPASYWRGVSGVIGGIPAAGATYTNLWPSNFLAGIASGIVNCPDGGVVQLHDGLYTITTDHIAIRRSNIRLRGEGTNTILKFVVNPAAAAVFVQGVSLNQAFAWSAFQNVGGLVSWTNGFTQGGSNLVVNTISNLSVGQIVCIDQKDDNVTVSSTGYEGACIACGRTQGGQRSQLQYAQVKAIADRTVTIWPPLLMPNWSASQTPEMWWVTTDIFGRGWVTNVGIENLTIDASECIPFDMYQGAIAFSGTFNCWVSNVWTVNPKQAHIYQYWGGNLEVRHSKLKGVQNTGASSYGFLPVLASGCLFEDNIVEDVSGPITFGWSASGNVVSYNYVTNVDNSGSANFMLNAVVAHDAHVSANAIEGNYVNAITADNIHGSSSHNAVFRNRILGWEPDKPSLQMALSSINLHPTNNFWSIVGNILGTSGVHTNYSHDYGDAFGVNKYYDWQIYTLGWANPGYWDQTIVDPSVTDTTFRHVNYDTVTGSIVYNATNADKTLPDSLVYVSKPTFFGILDWPPYNPTNTSAAQIDRTNIPSGFRFVYNYDPPAAAGPEVLVTGNGAVIANGDLTPSTIDGTHYGTNNVGSTVSHTFTVANVGTTDLTTSGLTVPLGFTVTEGLSATITAGNSDTFTVRFDSTADGTYTGSVSFGNNDSDENPFAFEITGITATVITPSTPGASQSSTLRIGTIKVN